MAKFGGMMRVLLLIEVIIRSILPPFYSLSLVEEICRKKQKKRPNDRQIIYLLTNFYVWYGMNQEAKNQLESLIDLRIAKKSDKLLLSKVYYRLRMNKEVVKILSEPNVLSDKDIENCYMGSSLVELGRFKDAVKYLEQYIKQHQPKDYLVFAKLGYAYYMEGLYDHALNAYQNAKRLNPSEKGIIDNINLCIEKQKSKESVFH